jgi:hypothetical protein
MSDTPTFSGLLRGAGQKVAQKVYWLVGAPQVAEANLIGVYKQTTWIDRIPARLGNAERIDLQIFQARIRT